MKKTVEWGEKCKLISHHCSKHLQTLTTQRPLKKNQAKDSKSIHRRKHVDGKKHKKGHIASLVIRKTQVKTAVRGHATLTRLAELKRASDNVEETAKGIPPKQWGRDAETGSEKRGPALSGHTHTHSPPEPQLAPALTRENGNERRAVTGLFPAAQAGKEPGAHRLASRHVNGAPDTHLAPVHGQPGAAESPDSRALFWEELGHVCPGSALFQLYRILEKAERRWWKPSW